LKIDARLGLLRARFRMGHDLLQPAGFRWIVSDGRLSGRITAHNTIRKTPNWGSDAIDEGQIVLTWPSI
jgi:hypothetical protein